MMKRLPLDRILSYILMAIAGLVMIMPFYFMIVTSFKKPSEAASLSISLFVKEPTLQAYRDLLQGLPYLQFMSNSLIVAIATTAGTMFFCTLAGYAFSKHRFPGREKIFAAILATMMVPGSVLLVPSFLLMRDFGWLNTYLPLIVPSLAGAFGIFLSRQFIDTIPDDLLDAARIDGCSDFRIYWNIILPLSKPLLATLGILTFLWSWNRFLDALIYIFDEKLYTLPLGISLLQGRFVFNENIQMAGAALAIIPVLIIFFILQKQIVKSLSTTGLKG
ncbi:MAG: carbohydrate ABC transporter permease [candidate division KSB1 bacterium]|nr:carbohydrate ABC transporter permease [candidate division KSB1 bacterium]MDZ7404656.1 carbohydrate ABC transporter permease [candidate division KSB1 bacterium]